MGADNSRATVELGSAKKTFIPRWHSGRVPASRPDDQAFDPQGGLTWCIFTHGMVCIRVLN